MVKVTLMRLVIVVIGRERRRAEVIARSETDNIIDLVRLSLPAKSLYM